MRDQKGFVLTELIVAGIIGAVFAGILVAFLRVQNIAVKEEMAYAKMQIQANILSEEIRKNVLPAALLLGEKESFSLSPAFAASKSPEVRMYDNTGKMFAGYRVNGGYLDEWDAGLGQWIQLKAGNTPVGMGAGSHFELPASRKRVTVNLLLVTTVHGKQYEYSSKGGMFSCRN
jgi:hypothetical protein